MQKYMRILTLLLVLLMIVPMIGCGTPENLDDTSDSTQPEETTENPTDKPAELVLYVSPEGSDENDGSKDAPFATINGARDAIRKLDKMKYTGITVLVGEGEYRITDR